MAKRMKLTGLAVVFGLVISAPMAKAETLADAMIGAYNSSGLLEQNRAVLRAADEDVAQAVAAEGALTVAREQYLAIVGRLPGGLQPLRGLPALPGSVESAKSIAVRNHPQVRSVQHQVAAAELNILRAEAAMKPTVRLSGRLTVTEGADTDRFTRGGSIGLEAGGPIYQGGRLTSLVRQAMANRDSARGQLHQVIDQVTQNVGNAYAQLRIAQASLESTERQVRAATVAFRGVREEAALGARTTLDVLNAEQELLNARSARISAQVDESIAAYRVLSTLGRLTATDLQLNVQQYDPVSYYNLVKESPIQKSKQGQQLDRVLKSLGKN